MDKDRARSEIHALVENYRQLSDAQKRQYSEEDVKKDFLLPLFRALGWDVENAQKQNEVRAEEKIADGYPDYSFRLNGVPVFFLEAKKFSVDINAEKPMKQAINYSYLKGVTWAVLSDFEGLKVFNADWEERNPYNAIFLDLQAEHYLNGQFEDLWLLSKEAIEAGAIDKLAERVHKKKKRDDVNKVLFADLTQWRRELFKEITQMGGTIFQNQNYRMVDEAIQRLLDRLIFIRTIEDRGIEENRLRSALRQYQERKGKKGNLFADLLALFRELDDIYNARLFARAALDEQVEIHDVLLLEQIINGLYDVKGNFATYDFAAIDADVLGAVYEQYLSFKAQDPEGKQEIDLSKRSKRKAQGIYYTPKYVVRYIVQQTLGKMLSDPDMTPEKAHNLRILDPACGSGSFLIEAFQVLDRWLAENGDAVDREFPRRRQMRILQENLFGVDLDPQAVEVARLNLLLQAAHQREKLPMLYNIKYGNSLISDPAVAGQAAFDWAEQFPDVMDAGGFDVVVGNPPYVRQETLGAQFKDYAQANYQTYAGTADLYVYFVEKALSVLKSDGLFGYIIPNKWMRAGYGKSLRQWLKNRDIQQIVDFGDLPVFEDATTYPCIMTIRGGAQDDSGLKPTANADSSTFTAAQIESLDFLSLEDTVRQRQYAVNKSALDDEGWSLINERSQSLTDKLTSIGVSLGDYVENKIYYGIKTGLNEVFVINENTRKSLIEADPRNSEIIKPFLFGRNIKRFQQPEINSHIIFTRRGINIADFPSILDYLSQYKSVLMPKPNDWNGNDWEGRKGGAYEWYEIQDTIDYFPEFEKPKIIYAEIATRGQFILDENNNYCDTTAFILGSDSKYLLGILNSRLWTWLFSNISSEIRGGFFRWKRQYMEKLPIRTINFDDPADRARHDRMVGMVERMLELKKDHAAAEAGLLDSRHELAAQITRLDGQIDALVYELYGLTDEEIAIVEG